MKLAKPVAYSSPEQGSITGPELKKTPREVQLGVMRRWFFGNYEDPVESCPYESSEGGYQFIWGGPYDAHEALSDQFGGLVPDDVIDELTHQLNKIATEWSGQPQELPDIDDYLLDVPTGSIAKSELDRNVSSIQLLLAVSVEPRQCFLRLLYINVITALETYLADFFISRVMADKNMLRKFVETNEDFRKEKVSISEIFTQGLDTSAGIEKRIKEYLREIVWHHLAKVKVFFGYALGIKFPSDMDALFAAVRVRHDLVHRSGKKKEDDTEHVLTENDVAELIKKLKTFVEEIENQSPSEEWQF